MFKALLLAFALFATPADEFNPCNPDTHPPPAIPTCPVETSRDPQAVAQCLQDFHDSYQAAVDSMCILHTSNTALYNARILRAIDALVACVLAADDAKGDCLAGGGSSEECQAEYEQAEALCVEVYDASVAASDLWLAGKVMSLEQWWNEKIAELDADFLDCLETNAPCQ